eukprot:scaffold2466_cov112-Skeletonema_marinoi.AAC.3
MKLILLTGAACIFIVTTSATAQEIHETTSNDPTSLCINNSIKLTGYKATKDCRGYVYCNNGYLTGGGIIPCRPNQLFDETLVACTYWQNVDTTTCPEFDGSKLMPNQYDTNANQDQFFCGQSWSDAKHVCEPCPGGSRLECSDVGHDCFAGVTGCRTPSAVSNNSVDNNSNSNNNDHSQQSSQQQAVFDTNINIIQSQQQPSPAIVFVNPTPPTTTTSFTSSSNTNNNNNKCTSHSNCQNGKLCNKQGYCGQCSNEGRGCSVDQVCRTTASCHVTQTPGPGKCYNKEELHTFCRTAWKEDSYQCNLDTMVCERSDDNFGSILGSPVQVQEEEVVVVVAPPTQEMTTISTTTTTPITSLRPLLYTNPLGNNYFCGASFSTVASNCLASRPCPNGFASGHCAAMEGCFRVNQCVASYNEAASITSTTASSVSSSSGVSLVLNEENTFTTTANHHPLHNLRRSKFTSPLISWLVVVIGR